MWRAVLGALLTLIATPLLAQATPFKNVDGNGVDLTDGSYNFSLVEGSAGSGEAAISLVRIWSGTQFFDNWSGRTLSLTTVGSNVSATVSMGATYDSFQYTGGIWVSRKRDGGTLTAVSSGDYIYRDSAGNILEFTAPIEDLGGTSNLCNSVTTTNCVLLATTIVQTNGRTIDIGWEVYANCSSAGGGGGPYHEPSPDDPPATQNCIYSWRFYGASNGHYGFSVAYASNSVTGGINPGPSWYQRVSTTFTGVPASIVYSYPSANVTQITTAAGRVWRFTTTSAKLTGIKRPGSASADTTTVTYSGSAVSSVTNNGVTTGYARSVSGITATMVTTDPNSNHVTVISDMALYRPTSVTDQLGRAASTTYDSYARPLETTAPEGNKTVIAYDARGNVTSTTLKAKPGSGLGDIVTSSYFPPTCPNPVTCNSPEYSTDARGHVTNFTYDGTTGQTLSVKLPPATSGGIRPETRYSYTTIGGLSFLSGTSTCRTTSSCAGTADEVVTSITYNAATLPATVSRGAGDGSLTATTSFTYDAVGNRTYVDGPLSGTADTTRTLYNAGREVIGVIGPDPDGGGALKNRAQRIQYNADGQPTSVEQGTTIGQTDPAWAGFVSLQSVTNAYDANGRKVSDATNGAGTVYGVNHYNYDALGRPDCSAKRMNSATWGSATTACTLQATGSFGPDRISKTTYDAASQVTKTTSAYGTADQSDDATLTYTANGKAFTLTDANGNLTTTEYDGFDRPAKVRYPLPTTPGASSTTDYATATYDAGSNVTQTRLRDGQVIGAAYDNLNRQTLLDLAGTGIDLDISYGYDLLGRMLTSSNPSGHITYNAYDALGRPVTEVTTYGGAKTSQYDLAGRRTRLTWYDGFYVTYDHLVTGETSAVRENGAASGIGVLATYAYDDLGRRTSVTRGNGTTTSYGYDSGSRLASLSLDLGGTAYDQSLTFSYNPASQITSNTRSNDAYAWSGHYNVDRPYGVNGLNQLTSAGATALAYDGRGNLTMSGATSYAYSQRNQLAGALGQTLYYDPPGRLDIIYNGTSGVTYDYDGSNLVSLGVYGGAPITKRFVFGPGTDEPLVEYSGSGLATRRWMHADERGSIVALSDDAGTATTINTYDEYGIPGTANSGTFQYTGQAWIAEIGMQYSKARMYSPTLGRFMQTDPIGYADGPNWYNYVGGDPVNLVDPSGLCTAAQLNKIEAKDGKIEADTIYVCGGGGGGGGGGNGFGGAGGGTILPNYDLNNLTDPIPTITVPSTSDETPDDTSFCSSPAYEISQFAVDIGKFGNKVATPFVVAGFVSGGTGLVPALGFSTFSGAVETIGNIGRGLSGDPTGYRDAIASGIATIPLGRLIPETLRSSFGDYVVGNAAGAVVGLSARKSPCRKK